MSDNSSDKEYASGYKAGRDGTGGSYAAKVFVIGETKTERAGRIQGEADGAKYGSRENTASPFGIGLSWQSVSSDSKCEKSDARGTQSANRTSDSSSGYSGRAQSNGLRASPFEVFRRGVTAILSIIILSMICAGLHHGIAAYFEANNEPGMAVVMVLLGLPLFLLSLPGAIYVSIVEAVFPRTNDVVAWNDGLIGVLSYAWPLMGILVFFWIVPILRK